MKLQPFVYLSLIALVASLSPVAFAQTFSVIHAFNGSDGAHPHAGVTLRAGMLYGTTSAGGGGGGSVYQMTRQGSNWTTTPIYLFTSNQLGENPWARVVFGPDGHLYGTTALAGDFGGGAVFDLQPPLSVCKTVSCMWKPTTLHGFSGGQDGYQPGYGDLLWDQGGNIYGSTIGGGNFFHGTVFQLTPSGNTWKETVIHDFAGTPDGAEPYSGLVIDSNGNLLGTTSKGGASRYGTIFQLSYVVGVGWQESILRSFDLSHDGGIPFGGLLLDSAGNLYGSTTTGGPAGGGAVFELTPSGNGYTFKLLYSFPSPGGICGPQASLTMDAAGNLYGTTICAGANLKGNVFRLTNTGNGWTYTSLHDFTGGADSQSPISNVTIDTNGTLYGTAAGGAGDYGVVWMIKP